MMLVAQRQGVAIVVVMGILLVLVTTGGLLRLSSQSAFHEVDTIHCHLRAVAVGEAGFATVTARLSAAPWELRWFRKGPELQYVVSAAGGVYSSLIQDTPASIAFTDPLLQMTLGNPHQADLLIRATYDRSTVVMFWRLTVPQDSLESLVRAVPSYFVFAPNSVEVDPRAVDALSGQITDSIKARGENASEMRGLAQGIRSATRVDEISSLLGFTPAQTIVDGVVPAGGSGVLEPNAPRIDAALGASTTVSPVAPPPDTADSPVTESCPLPAGLECGGPVPKGCENPGFYPNSIPADPDPDQSSAPAATQLDFQQCVDQQVLPRLQMLVTCRSLISVSPLSQCAALCKDQLKRAFASTVATEAPTQEQRAAVWRALGLIRHAQCAHLDGKDPLLCN